MKLTSGTIVLLTLLAAAAGCGPRPVSADAISGTYAATMTDEALYAVGAAAGTRTAWKDQTFIAEFTPDGVHRLSEVTSIGPGESVEATFSLTAETITFSDESGQRAARCADKGPGQYAWALDGDQLRLTPIQDDCDYRRMLLSAMPWTRQP